MSRRAGAALFLAMALLFLIANRGAYKGYFQDDELDNISWAPDISNSEFAQYLVTPKFLTANFRPVGHFYFHYLGEHVGLDFPKYIVPLHALHLLNVWLIWLIARRLGAGPFAAGSGALFFAFNMVVFDVLWKPMYIFDLCCATFCLASLLFYIRRWWIASFAAFWLAYKSKELAVMLPAVLACYEYWLGQRRWKPLVPFFLVSLSFGIQGLLLNPNRNNDYAFHFTPRSILKTASFYANDILFFPFAGLILPVLPFLTRKRLVWFGIAAMFLFFVPLGLLRNRTFDAYCYVPLTGVALACAGIASTSYRKLVIAFFVLWIGWNEFELKLNRRRALAVDDENRAYVAALGEAAAAHPDARTFIYDGAPFSLHAWGIQGALRIVYHTGDIRLVNIEEKGSERLLDSPRVVILSWDSPRRQLSVAAHEPGAPDSAYIKMNHSTPLWQLRDGWYGLENFFRWTQPRAKARLTRPAGARTFELTANISPDMLRDIGHTDVELRIDGQSFGRRRFDAAGWQTVRWDLPAAPAGDVTAELQADPVYHPPSPDTRELGVPVVGFGFVPNEDK
jgi:hypothetical protein